MAASFFSVSLLWVSFRLSLLGFFPSLFFGFFVRLSRVGFMSSSLETWCFQAPESWARVATKLSRPGLAPAIVASIWPRVRTTSCPWSAPGRWMGVVRAVESGHRVSAACDNQHAVGRSALRADRGLLKARRLELLAFAMSRRDGVGWGWFSPSPSRHLPASQLPDGHTVRYRQRGTDRQTSPFRSVHRTCVSRPWKSQLACASRADFIPELLSDFLPGRPNEDMEEGIWRAGPTTGSARSLPGRPQAGLVLS